MNTVSDLKKRILLLLGDDIASGAGEEIYGGQYSVDALLAGIHAALDSVLPWMCKHNVLLLTSSTDGYTFTLPSDFYQIDGITSSSYFANNTTVYGTFSPMETFRAREIPNTDDNFWILYPHGKIVFSKKIDLTAGAKAFYSATWAKPTTDITELETPEYAMTALSFSAASIVLLTKAVSGANIRQFNTKVDSGTPEDNPILKVSTYYQRMFDICVQRLPVLPRGVIQ